MSLYIFNAPCDLNTYTSISSSLYSSRSFVLLVSAAGPMHSTFTIRKNRSERADGPAGARARAGRQVGANAHMCVCVCARICIYIYIYIYIPLFI